MGAHIGALVADELDFEPVDHAPGVHRDPQHMTLVSGVVGRYQMLLAVLHPLDRPTQPQRGEGH